METIKMVRNDFVFTASVLPEQLAEFSKNNSFITYDDGSIEDSDISNPMTLTAGKLAITVSYEIGEDGYSSLYYNVYQNKDNRWDLLEDIPDKVNLNSPNFAFNMFRVLEKYANRHGLKTLLRHNNVNEIKMAQTELKELKKILGNAYEYEIDIPDKTDLPLGHSNYPAILKAGDLAIEIAERQGKKPVYNIIQYNEDEWNTIAQITDGLPDKIDYQNKNLETTMFEVLYNYARENSLKFYDKDYLNRNNNETDDELEL